MKKIKDIPVELRPRQKLIDKGAPSLSDIELLSIILGKGSKKTDVFSLSKKILKTIDSNGYNLRVEDLTKIQGIGEAKATLILAAIEFSRRRIKPQGIKISTPKDILPLLTHYSDRKQEHFITISINGAGEVLNLRVVTIGLINKTQVHPREVFADIIQDRASALIIAHNHPSGSLKPSKEDIKITKTIKDSSKIIGINLLDHIIFTQKGYFSFLENDLL